MVGLFDASIKSDFFLPSEVAAYADKGKIAVSNNGVGVVLAAGMLYQPLSVELANFPKPKLRQTLETALKAADPVRLKAGDLRDVLDDASQFLLDKSETAKIESVKGGLNITSNISSGKFQKTIPVVAAATQPVSIEWRIKRLLPWLDFAVAAKTDNEIEYVKIPSASAFRFEVGKINHVFVFADV